MVGLVGFEPTALCTPCIRATRLRYNPKMVEAHGLEPGTFSMSRKRSNQLSYATESKGNVLVLYTIPPFGGSGS